MQHLLHEPTPKKKIIHAENVKLWAHMLIALERGRSALNLNTLAMLAVEMPVGFYLDKFRHMIRDRQHRILFSENRIYRILIKKTLYILSVSVSKAFFHKKGDKAMPVNAVSQNGVWPTYIAHTEQVVCAGRDAE